MKNFYRLIQGDCMKVLPQLEEESVDFVMFSPPYWGLRDYGEATATIWGGSQECDHSWSEERMTLVHENRNFTEGTQEEVHGAKPTTFIKKYDDLKAGFCVKCGAWRVQLGLEPHPQLYISHMVEVFRAIRRVLKKTGSVYVVLGDTYFGGGRGQKLEETSPKQFSNRGSRTIVGMPKHESDGSNWLLPKQKLLIPYRLAIALQEDSWILRNDIIWSKPNAMPSSVKDRLNVTHEIIFHFVKSKRYYYNLDAIREPHITPLHSSGRKDTDQYGEDLGSRKRLLGIGSERKWGTSKGKNPGDVVHTKHDLAVNRLGDFSYTDPLHTKAYNLKGKNPGDTIKIGMHHGSSLTKGRATHYEGQNIENHPLGSNPGDFWSLPTKPFKGAHFAVYPEKLCVRPILSSCPPNGIVLDPMAGSGTTMKVARDLGRSCIAIELNPQYCEIARKRCFGKTFIDREVEYSFEVFGES